MLSVVSVTVSFANKQISAHNAHQTIMGQPRTYAFYAISLLVRSVWVLTTVYPVWIIYQSALRVIYALLAQLPTVHCAQLMILALFVILAFSWLVPDYVFCVFWRDVTYVLRIMYVRFVSLAIFWLLLLLVQYVLPLVQLVLLILPLFVKPVYHHFLLKLWTMYVLIVIYHSVNNAHHSH